MDHPAHSISRPSTPGRWGGQPIKSFPLWRREPYRVFFPMGMLLAWAGVLHWLLHAVGWVAGYASVFHSIAQIQGFMMCFAVGFLFTAIPRFTNTAPPSSVEMVIAVLAPVGTTLAAWFEHWLVSQLFWFALVATLTAFVVRRLVTVPVDRRPPNSFIWVGLSLLMGVIGSLLIGMYQMAGGGYFWLHDLGRLLLLQGMFIGFVLGVGGLVLPMITRNEPMLTSTPAGSGLFKRTGHILAATLLMLSFEIEVIWSLRWGLALRCLVVLVVLLASAKLWQRPCVAGWHRKVVWLSAWMIPAGYALAAAFPILKKAGLHVVFIGGFAMMAFSVGLHVVLAHGSFQRLLGGRPWQVGVFAVLFLLAVVLRVLVDLDRSHFHFWLGGSAAAFLLGTLFWASLVLPRIWVAHGGDSPRS